MTSSFPHRLIAAVFQSAVVLFEHLPPLIAATLFLLAIVAVVTVSVAVPWQAARLVVHVWRWVRRQVADREALAELNREYAELCDTFRPDGPANEPDDEHLPGVTRIGPATPPPVRRAARRRRMPVRIPRRYPRPSDFKRKARS